MKKYALLLVGSSLILAALSVREWLLTEEISITQSQIREQLTQSIQAAQNVDRVRHLSTSTIVFERCFEPVFEACSRLIWAPLRASIMTDWKREIHTQIDDVSAARIAELTGESEKQIAKLKAEGKPSVSRLVEILRLSEGNPSAGSCTAAVQEEMKLVKEAGQKKDEETLATLKADGLRQIKHFQKLIKGMTQAQLGQFLKSGRFTREIQQPILDAVFQIKQEELRKAAWDEFEKKIQGVLSKKGFPVDKVKDHALRAQQQINRLFNEMTEAKGNNDLPAIPPYNTVDSAESKLVIPEPRIPISPSDANAGQEDASEELRSPADADAVE